MNNSSEIAAQSGAETRNYLVITGSDIDAKDRWYKHCQRAKIPWIVVTKKGKLADIDVDLFTLPGETEHVINAKRDKLTAGYRDLHNQYGTKKSSCGPAPSGPYFYDIPVDRAEDLIMDLLYFLNHEMGMARVSA